MTYSIKELDGKMGVSEVSGRKTTVITMPPYLEDSFHPNTWAMKDETRASWEKSMPRRKLGVKNNPIKEKVPSSQNKYLEMVI